MVMSWQIRVLVFVLTTCMCCISGLATLRKLRSADPFIEHPLVLAAITILIDMELHP